MISLDNLTVSYGGWTLFDNISLLINPKDRIGLVGKNGAGKTTLLRLIVGEQQPTSGSISYNGECTIGYLPQQMRVADTTTLVEETAKAFDEVLKLEAEIARLTREIAERTDYESSDYESLLHRLNEATDHYHILGGDTREADIEKTLLGLGFKRSDFQRATSEFSGGWRMRIELAKLLLRRPSIFLLDEPTNHLDLEMIEWLEGYLNRGNKTIFMVTHDRFFLDKVCNTILELDDRTIYTYRGNYAYYLEKRQERMDNLRAEIQHSKNLYRRELDWMRRQPQARGHKAKYREDAFYELEKVAKQRIEDRQVRLKASTVYIGSKIFECQYVSKAFDDRGQKKVILDNFYYNFARFEKMGIVGNNGTGKSTFIKMLLGEVQPDSGKFDIGETVRFGYFSQEGLKFREDQKVIDVITEIADYIDLGGGKHMTASQFLQFFLFTPEEQHNYVYKLSGGEKRKLYLCTVLMRNPNFLVLDEPTNDLDIQTLQVLEEYLQDFAGCVIVVSHDRYFMDKVVDHLLVFKGEGEIQDFPGNYTQYREWSRMQAKDEAGQAKPAKNGNATAESDGAGTAKRDANFENKRKMSYKEKREYEQLTQEIDALTEEQKKLEEELCSGNLSVEELTEKSKRLPEIKDELDEKEMRWLELAEML